MARWEPNARGRLERAALELFVERGFAETTVPAITARAGLTTRTFFRHFADKREVLFAVEDEAPTMVAGLLADAPASLGPMALIAYGLETRAADLEDRREYLRTRRTVIQADNGLRERELRKVAELSDAIAEGFRSRDKDELTSALAAQIAVTTFGIAIGRWLDQDGNQPLADLVRDTLGTLQAITADPVEQSRVV